MSLFDFHRDTFALLHHTPEITEETTSQLICFESIYRVELPLAVHAWFSFANTAYFLQQHSPDGHAPILLEHYLRRANTDYPDLALLNLQKLVHMGWFAFLVECQGIGYWAVPLGKEADPPVVFVYDTIPLHIEPRAATFSSFLTQWIRDGRTLSHTDLHSSSERLGVCTAWAVTKQLTQQEYLLLEQYGLTLRPNALLHRFDRQNGTLLLEEHPTENRVHWYIVEYWRHDAPFSEVQHNIQICHTLDASPLQIVREFLATTSDGV